MAPNFEYQSMVVFEQGVFGECGSRFIDGMIDSAVNTPLYYSCELVLGT